MPELIIRDLPADVYQHLVALAASHSRSVEVEARSVLTTITDAANPLRMGDALWKLLSSGPENSLDEEEWAAIDGSRDRTPAEPMDFDDP